MDEEYDIAAPGEGYIQSGYPDEDFTDEDEGQGVDPYSGRYYI